MCLRLRGCMSHLGRARSLQGRRTQVVPAFHTPPALLANTAISNADTHGAPGFVGLPELADNDDAFFEIQAVQASDLACRASRQRGR